VETVTGGINYNFAAAKQQRSKILRTDYLSKLSLETGTVSVGQVIQSPSAIVGQVESNTHISA
jgi:hypothetical protein